MPAVSPVELSDSSSSSRSRSRWLRRRKLGEGAGDEKSSAGVGRRRYEDPLASIVDGVVKRLTSTPRYENGAQQANAQGIPQIETSTVAICKERTKGARNMAPAKTI